MKITRLHRAIFLMATMLFMGIYVFFTLPGEKKFDIYDFLPLAVMMIGVLCCAYSMRYGLKRVLSVTMVVLGVYLMMKVGTMVIAGDGHTLTSFVLAVAMGGLSVLLGATIWLGYDYNVIRVRLCMLIVLIGCAVMIIIEGRYATDAGMWWDNSHLFLAIGVLSGAVVLVTMDPSMDLPTLGSGVKDNILSMKRRVISTDDAYILTSDVEAIRKHIDSAEKEPMEVLVRSNNFMSFNIIVTNKDNGEHLLEIRDLEKIFLSTLIAMRFTQVAYAEDHITFYSDCGNATKLLVFDEIQENMDLPLILGHQIDIRQKK